MKDINKLPESNDTVTITSAHPGYADTELHAKGFMRMKGWPVSDKPNPKRVTDETAGRLWEVSEELTGVKFPV